MHVERERERENFMVVCVLEVVVEKSLEITEGSVVSVFCGCGSDRLDVVSSYECSC